MSEDDDDLEMADLESASILASKILMEHTKDLRELSSEVLALAEAFPDPNTKILSLMDRINIGADRIHNLAFFFAPKCEEDDDLD